MINNTPAAYVFIRGCVIFLHYLTPTCIAYVLTSVAFYGFGALRYPVPIAIEVLAALETLFYLCVFLPYKQFFQYEARHPPTLPREERRKLFEKCNAEISDPGRYISKWFLGADPEKVKRENVVEFILWAFFNRGGPAGEDEDEVEEYIQIHEKSMGRKFERGRGDVKSLRLTLDSIEMLHRSLVWYFCVGFVDFLTYVNLSFQGFRHHRAPLTTLAALFPPRPIALTTPYVSPVKTSYWHRPHKSKTHLPILFLHGIGIGLYPYTNFLCEINEGLPRDEEIGVIALEILPISFRLSPAPLSSSELCKEISTILEHHGYSQVVLAAHSYGSVIATHLLSSPHSKDKIADLLLIDPVSILLHLPDVAYNFVRRKPHTAAEWQLWYFASMDMGVARALGRHFFWSENVVWKEDLGLDHRRVTVSLAGRDLIVDTEAVGRYLATGESKSGEETDVEDDHSDQNADDARRQLAAEGWKHRHWHGKGLEMLWFEHLDHAQVFDKAVTRARLVNVLRTYSDVGVRQTGVANGGNWQTNGHAKKD